MSKLCSMCKKNTHSPGSTWCEACEKDLVIHPKKFKLRENTKKKPKGKKAKAWDFPVRYSR